MKPKIRMMHQVKITNIKNINLIVKNFKVRNLERRFEYIKAQAIFKELNEIKYV